MWQNSQSNNIEMSLINVRSLSNYVDTTKNLNISYDYNVDVIRISKLVDGVETKYYLENSKMLKKNAEDVVRDTKNMNPVQKLNYFIENVDDGKKYDLKLTDEWKEKTVSYDGIIMEAQDIGNFNFGYIGRALGYDAGFLTFGAGVNQELNKNRYTPCCFTLSFCDDPRDSYYIGMGAIKYDNEN